MHTYYKIRSYCAEVAVFSLILALGACSPSAKSDNAARDSISMAAHESTDPSRARGPLSDSGSGSPSTVPVGTASSVAMSDTVLANIVAVADRGEIEAGKLAASKGTDSQVKAFARMMIDTHSKDLAATTRLMRDGALAMADSGMTSAPGPQAGSPVAQMMAKHRETMESLRQANGAAFDRLYADAMVAGHQELLQTLTQNAGSANNDALKKHLAAVEKVVTAHLERAKDVQKRLADRAAAAPSD